MTYKPISLIRRLTASDVIARRDLWQREKMRRKVCQEPKTLYHVLWPRHDGVEHRALLASSSLACIGVNIISPLETIALSQWKDMATKVEAAATEPRQLQLHIAQTRSTCERLTCSAQSLTPGFLMVVLMAHPYPARPSPIQVDDSMGSSRHVPVASCCLIVAALVTRPTKNKTCMWPTPLKLFSSCIEREGNVWFPRPSVVLDFLV